MVTRPPGTVPRQNVGESIGKCFPHSFPAVGGTGSHVHGRAIHGVRVYPTTGRRVHGIVGGIYLSPTVSALANLTNKHRGTPRDA